MKKRHNDPKNPLDVWPPPRPKHDAEKSKLPRNVSYVDPDQALKDTGGEVFEVEDTTQETEREEEKKPEKEDAR